MKKRVWERSTLSFWLKKQTNKHKKKILQTREEDAEGRSQCYGGRRGRGKDKTSTCACGGTEKTSLTQICHKCKTRLQVLGNIWGKKYAGLKLSHVSLLPHPPPPRPNPLLLLPTHNASSSVHPDALAPSAVGSPAPEPGPEEHHRNFILYHLIFHTFSFKHSDWLFFF